MPAWRLPAPWHARQQARQSALLGMLRPYRPRRAGRVGPTAGQPDKPRTTRVVGRRFVRCVARRAYRVNPCRAICNLSGSATSFAAPKPTPTLPTGTGSGDLRRCSPARWNPGGYLAARLLRRSLTAEDGAHASETKPLGTSPNTTEGQTHRKTLPMTNNAHFTPRSPLDTRPGRKDKSLPRGVYYTRPGSTRFKALGRLNKRLIFLGTFDTIAAANAAAISWRKGNAAAVAWYKASKASNQSADA